MRSLSGVTGASGVTAVPTAGMACVRASDGAGIKGEWDMVILNVHATAV